MEALKQDKLNGILRETWGTPLSKFIESVEMDKILSFIRTEKAQGKRIVPRADRVFTALNLCPPDKIKVIMGLQDPYNSIEPDGLAMSCSLTTGPVQPSLAQVQREIRRTVKDYNTEQPRDLSYLAEQGILLINASLTVQWKEPNSHKGLWDKFIDEVFHEVVNKTPHPIVYILLGKEAEKFTRYARLGDYLLHASHPASAAYSGGAWDCNGVFTTCNFYLEQNELTSIKW